VDQLRQQLQKQEEREQQQYKDEELEKIPKKVSSLLTKIYFNPSRVGSYGGYHILTSEANKILEKTSQQPVSERVVKLWLSGQVPYVLHKRVRTRKFKRRVMRYEPFKGKLMQADIIFYSDIPHYGYKYLLLVQDTATRYLMYKFLKTKTCAENLKKIKEIFSEIKLIPKNLLVDSGGEWFCKEFENWAKENNCNVYAIGSGDSGKIPHLDRVTRYIQERLATVFTHKETSNWVQIIPRLISSQNRTFSRSIGMTPKEAWEKPLGTEIVQIKKHQSINERSGEMKRVRRKVRFNRFKIGQWVSILGPDYGTMQHKYKGQWTLTKFKIVRINKVDNKNIYYLEDELGEPIKNGFYESELTEARYEPFKRIEKVLKKQTVDGVKYVLVRYKRQDKRFDAWIKEKDLTTIPKVVVKRRKRRTR